ncbi:unnamed protein product [Brassica rapa subsp. narinosa]
MYKNVCNSMELWKMLLNGLIEMEVQQVVMQKIGRDLLDIPSTKVPERKLQRETNPGTKNKQSSSSFRRNDPIRLGRWPNWIEHATSSAIRQAGSNTRTARPSAELDSPVWQMAELD